MPDRPVINFAVHEVRAGKAGAWEDFTQMIGLLVHATSGQEAHLTAEGPGDWGIDVLVGDLNAKACAWQVKYFTAGGSRSRWTRVRDSFHAAVRYASESGYALGQWTLCVPSTMDAPTSQWWQAWKAEQEQATGTSIALWDETRLRELLHRPEAADVYRHYYAPHIGGQTEHRSSEQPMINFAVHDVRAGKAAAREDFIQMIRLLTRATSGQQANLVVTGTGDWGGDALMGSLNGRLAVWQPVNFRAGVRRPQWDHIVSSFDAAVRGAARHGHTLEQWILCVPSSMDAPVLQRWQAWKAEQEQATGATITLWDETKLRGLLLRPEAAAIYRYFYAPGTRDALDSDSDDSDLIFRVYVPSDRLYAAELDSLLSLFRDWMSNVRGHGIRRGGYETRSGKVYELYLSRGSAYVDFDQERIDFSDFLARCAGDPAAAAESLVQGGIEQAEACSIASRYGRQVRRLNLDLKQERERRILGIWHDLESDLVDSGGFPEAAAHQIRGMLDILVPDLSAATYRNILQLGGQPRSAGIEINIHQQVVGTVEGTVIQNVSGTVNLGAEARELLSLIQAYGRAASDSLRTAVFEVEDTDAPLTKRQAARKQLAEFLRQVKDVARDVGTDLLEKYLESKMGR